MVESVLSPRQGLVMPILAASVGMAVQGAALILAREEAVAAGLTAAIGLLLVAAGRSARRTGSPRLLLADAVAERVADALLLGSVAWVNIPDRPIAGAAALGALVASYLASYLRARAAGLGFDLAESTVDRGVLMAALALGLATDLLEVGLLAAATFSLSVTVRRATEVARHREAR